MIILGIETSCDETAAAVVTDKGMIRSNVILSQRQHQAFGGVVPEIAARAHLEHIDQVTTLALKEAKVSFSELDAVAATGGPGLVGGLIVGIMTAKAIACVHKIPFHAVNHLEGHALSPRLTLASRGKPLLEFPFLLLLVSGGHCQILAVTGIGRYERLGTTIDDALGEAFDKTSKMMGLGYPGGPPVERMALKGDKNRFDLPRPLLGRKNCHFSFSGLKTAVRQSLEKLPEGPLEEKDIHDLCASFQAAVGDVLIDRCQQGIEIFQKRHGPPTALVIAGGVAANEYLLFTLSEMAANLDLEMIAPPPELCGDNAAMIAWAALERGKEHRGDSLDFKPRPRWPLDTQAPPATGQEHMLP